MRLPILFAIGAIIVLGAAIAAAQEGTRVAVSGTVTDPSGAVVPDAKITAKRAGCTCKQCKPPEDRDCGCCANQIVRSGSDGSFRFFVVPGTYRLDVTAGARSASLSVDVSAGASNTVHITLQ